MSLSWDGSVPDFHPDAKISESHARAAGISGLPYPIYEIRAELESVDQDFSLFAMHDPPNLPVTLIPDLLGTQVITRIEPTTVRTVPPRGSLITSLLALRQSEYIDFYIPVHTDIHPEMVVFIRHKLENSYETIKTVCNSPKSVPIPSFP